MAVVISGGIAVMRDDSGFPVGKVQSPELEELASGEAEGDLSVLIQIEAPSPQLRVARGAMMGQSPQRSVAGFIEDSPRRQAEIEERIADTERFLTKILNTKPKLLRSARAFVATVNGREIREIARSPLVRSIHLNRQLKMP